MVRKSYGKKHRTRDKLKTEKITINRHLVEFSVGDAVHIDFTTNNSIQHPRFQGLTGKIIEKRGRSYMIGIRDGHARKKIFVRPEHLRRQI